MKIGNLEFQDKTKMRLICYMWFKVNKVDEIILSQGIKTRLYDSEHDSVQLAPVIRSFTWQMYA